MAHQAINVNDVIDHAKFKPFHFNVVAWCLLIILFDGYDLAINGVVLPLLMDEWGLSAVQAGMLASTALAGMMFGAMIFGSLADKIGRKKVIMICIVLFSGLTFAGMFCFLTSGSIVYIGIYGISQEYVGYFFGLNMVVMVIMTAINSKMVVKVGSEKMLQIALVLQVLGGIWLALTAMFELGFWAMALGVPCYIGMISTIASNASAAILDRYPQMAGTASGVAGTARFGIASLVVAGLSHITIISAAPMLYTMALCTITAGVVYYFLCYKSL